MGNREVDIATLDFSRYSTHGIKYNLDDHLGSSNVLVDENGTLLNFEEYYPFGETSFGSYAKKRYRYCGKERDEESGLYYYGARYYAPWLCRFTSVDPLAAKYMQLTPYNYAGNEPIGDKDIDGQQSVNTPQSANSSGNSSTQGASTQSKPVLPENLVHKLNDTSIPGTGKNSDFTYSKVEAVQNKIEDKKGISNLNISQQQTTVKADDRTNAVRETSIKKAETFFTTIETANKVSSLPIVGGMLDPVISSPIRAGAYNGMDMPEQRNAEMLNATIGITAILLAPELKIGTTATKGLQLTKHGAERIAGAAATRGGVLSVEEIGAIKSLVQKPIIQGDGAEVFIHEISPGRFSGFIENQNTGKLITTMNNWSKKSINKMGKNHGWSVE